MSGEARPLTGWARQALDARAAAHLLRDRSERVLDGAPGPHVTLAGRVLLNFASNGYLGLSLHPRVVAAFQREAARTGTSSTSARLVAGNLRVHTELESALAALKGRAAALLMSSGYQANLGVLAAVGRLLRTHATPLFLSDALNHASIIDGCRLAHAEVAIYPHGDATAARALAAAAGDRPVVIVTESRFSMDGDIAPLAALADLAEACHGALIVDEAHSTGVDGEGRGLVHALGLNARVDLVIGTLGKALGAHGAFVAGAADVCRFIENTARPFIYTTALPAAVAAAAQEALAVLQEERPDLRLWSNVRMLAAACAHLPIAIAGPIVKLVAGPPEAAQRIAGFLEACQILAVAIRPPTVPRGTSRIRLALRADHTASDVMQLAEALSKAYRAGLIPHDRFDR